MMGNGFVADVILTQMKGNEEGYYFAGTSGGRHIS